jgi:ketosteroid isomerase-like protein
MHRSGRVLLVGVGLCACSSKVEQQPPATTVNATAVARRAIDSANANLERWYATGYADSIASAFAVDARQMPPNGPPIVGRDSVRAFWAGMLPMGRWIFDFATDDVVAADSVAVERGHYIVQFTAGRKGGIPSFDDRGNYIVLWRRESDGKWRVVWDAPVSELPPPKR